jgi:hypothetical protein
MQDYIVSFAAKGMPGGKVVSAFPDYGKGTGSVLHLNVVGLGTVMPDALGNARCKYWQDALWI